MTVEPRAIPGGEALAPTEVVFLHGDQFAPAARALDQKTALLHTDAKVSAARLGEAIFAAMVLANEQAGAVRLEVRPEKALLGLRKVKNLYVLPSGTPFEWPAHSLEYRLLAALRDGPARIGDLVYRFLGEDSYAPWASAVALVPHGLHARGLLETEERKVLRIIPISKLRLPEGTASLAARHPIEPISALLAGCQRGRTEVWEALTAGIAGGVSRRKRQDQTDVGD